MLMKIRKKKIYKYDEINNNENPFYDGLNAPEGCIKRKAKRHKKNFHKKR